jgi:hypothetical protein
LSFAWHARRDPKTREQNLSIPATHENIGWLDVLVDQISLGHFADGHSDADSNT